MPESSNNESVKRDSKALDLSELQNLSFGPNWSERKESQTSGGRGAHGSRGPAGDGARHGGGGRDRRPQRSDRSFGGGGQGRPAGDRPQGGEGQRGGDRPSGDRFRGPRFGDRQRSFGGGEGRPAGEQPQGGEGQRGAPRPDRGGERGGDRGRFRGGNRGGERGGFRGERQPHEAPFDPVVDVLFYPEDTPFKALSHAMRSSCRTYELFEIARLILDKPDRHVIVIKPREDGKGITQLYQSVVDGLPFESEEAAVAHVLKNKLDRFFEVEVVSCEAPKGNFPVVNRCGLTGKLIAPPNYHRYQQLLQEHYANELSHLPLEKFQSRIESVKDEAVIAQWLEQMSTRTNYKLKNPQEGEQEVFESLEAVKLFLTTRRAAELVRKVAQIRIAGTAVDTLPEGIIRKSLFAAINHQKRFPLESANNLRGRLRRLKFTIYKRKGVSFVCAVKRNFRDEQSRFSESVQALVSFIEANPNVLVSQLPQRYLGIELKKAERTALPAREKAPDIESVSEEEARKIVEVHELKHQGGAARAAGEETAAEGTEAAAAQDAESAAAATAAADAADAAAEQAQLEDPRVRQLLNDLRWLITEGYVTEFGDGRLYAAPIQKGPHPSDDEDDSAEDSAAGASAAEATPATAETSAPAAVEAAPVAEAVEAPAAVEAAAEAATETPAEEKPEA